MTAGGTAAAQAAVRAMLEARSVALVGASERADSFGARMIEEVSKSHGRPRAYLVNPKYPAIGGERCYPSLADLPEPVDLVLLGVPDAALERQLELAAGRGDRSAVIFGNAHEAAPANGTGAAGLPLRQRLASIARSAGMELCGAGCMGFANISYGLRAMGYTEPDPLPAGPVALVTHSGSVFSALLRARRAFGFTVAVSSGQELVTTAPAYLRYALELPQTRVLALVLEAMRDAGQLRQVLGTAAERELPVVLLTAGSSDAGRAMVAAHSGALAAGDGGWEALCRAYGVHRVADLAELADTLELFALRSGRRAAASPAAAGPAAPAARPSGARHGIATVHDSGLERAHLADLAASLNVPYAQISPDTKAALASLLDPGLEPANPLDVWGTGDRTQQVFGDTVITLAGDAAVSAVALAVDLVPELDGDRGYPLGMLDAAAATDKPLAVLSNLASVLDQDAAATLRAAGIAVLEGSRSGLLALRHLLDHQASTRHRAATDGTASTGDSAGASSRAGHDDQGGQTRRSMADHASDTGRRARALKLLAAGQHSSAPQLALLREYGIATARTERVTCAGAAVAAAASIGYPVVLKTDEPAIAHKSDAGGVLLGIGNAEQLTAAYAGLAASLGPAAMVCETVPGGTELALGIVRDHDLGPLLVVGAGGVLVELLSDRAVALPPVSAEQASELLSGLRVRPLLDGLRGAEPADLDAVVRAITSLSDLASELGDQIVALDVNPMICGPAGAVAVDALVIAARRG